MNNEGSAWSVDALKEYMDRRFQTMTDAIGLANTTLDARLEGMNEFRSQILGERNEFVSKSEYEGRHRLLEGKLESDSEKIETRVNAIERWQAKLLGAMGLVLIMIPLLTALIVYYISRGSTHVPSTVTVTVPSSLR